MFKTSREVSLKFQRFHDVTVPSGTTVTRRDAGYTVEPSSVVTTSPRGKGTIWDHDATHFYIWVPAEYVVEG